MDEILGPGNFDNDQQNFLGTSYGVKRYGDQTAEKIDVGVKKILDRCFERALSLLQEAQPILVESAELLLIKETLKEDELQSFFQKLGQPS